MILFGPDGSHHQRAYPGPAGSSYALWRASISDRIDETFRGAVAHYRRHDVPFLGYHFLYQTSPRRGTTSKGRSIRAQVAALEKAIEIADAPRRVMLDHETDTKIVDGRPVVISEPTFDETFAFAAETRRREIAVPMFYTGRWYWSGHGAPDLAAHFDYLVNADYGRNPGGTAAQAYAARGGDSGRGWSGYGGLRVAMWQFSSNVTWPGMTQRMDANAIKDPAVLARCFHHWNAPPTPGPPLEEDDMINAGELDDFTDAVPVARALNPDDRDAHRWFNAMILRVGSVADVQRRHQLPISGRYNQATAEAYDAELAAMKAVKA